MAKNTQESALLGLALSADSHETGMVHSPHCCGQKMKDDGGCAEGCCDDFKCEICGKEIRVEWPD